MNNQSNEGTLLIGDIKYISHTVKEGYELPNPLKIEGLIDAKLNVEHLKGDGHIIEVNITQGFAIPKSREIILTLDSQSIFKLTPFSKTFFNKPATNELVKFLTDITQIACHNNTGMYVIIREDYGFEKLLPKPVQMETLQRLIKNQINAFLLN